MTWSIPDRQFFEEREERELAPFASLSRHSRGRRFEEEPHEYRTTFQRDRERIIHSRAFRRLEYKTQVFLNHEGDHYRTRLTHTIEVAQISRTIARALRLNEDLAESMALAHDLGHTPFGHAGERALNSLLANHGGFEHNRQSLRIVDSLEHRYPRFNGLNLTFETREGIIKHAPPYSSEYPEFPETESPSLEAQIIDLADEVAYNNHDLDDGLSSGLLTEEEVRELPIWQWALHHAGPVHNLTPKMRIRAVIRSLINLLATDLLQQTMRRVEEHGITTADQVRRHAGLLAGLSESTASMNRELKTFLRQRLYQHYKVARMTIKAEKVINELFEIYTAHPDTLPESFQKRIDRDGLIPTATDYIAGMTDRFALEEHTKLTDPTIRV